MTESEQFASLTIKELRQLAGEQQIHNRSRLSREDLIQALHTASQTRSTQLPSPSQPAIEAAASASSAAGGSPSPVPLPVQEPEILDLATLAPAAEQADDGGDESLDDGPNDEAGDQTGPPGQPGEFGEPGRRRRRRRGRGRGRGRNGPFDGQQPGGSQDGIPGQPPRDLAIPHGPSGGPEDISRPGGPPLERQGVPSVNPVRIQVPQSDSRPQRPEFRGQDPRDGRRDDRGPMPDSRRDDRGPRDQRPIEGNRPPRPRIEGPSRNLTSVLDRLCTFSRGLLELCDPSTPSWAQPRIAELLAEAGISPTPCTGQPHPDFHTIIGTVVTTAVPPGHIAEVTTPGFSLRGDRGDLFPVRKAQIRIAGLSRQNGPVNPSQLMAATSQSLGPVQVSAATASAPRMDDARGQTTDLGPADIAAVSAPVARQQPPTATDTGTSPQSDTTRAPTPPAAGRDPQRTHAPEPANAAPALPLAPQMPEELAQRPKAEGFRGLGLNEQILADLASVGWKDPSPIQSEAIPHVLLRRDVLGQAQTGTGKTGAFALPLLQRLYSLERPQGSPPAVLVLAPTRELARQVHTEFVKMAGASGARAALVYGGVPMDEQFRALERAPHIVIGTPGRIIDHMKRRSLDLSKLDTLILDEADQMLDIGFWPDIQYVVSHTPPTRQMLLFSATFPQPILDLIGRHMKEPVHIRITPKQVTVEQVDQKFIAVARERKNELLRVFIEKHDPPQLIVFCKTKHQTDRVAEVLKRKNKSAEAIHGDLPQSRRERALQAFRDGKLQALIATNVAARGLDIPTVSHVVNYDIPETPEEYVHRIGRTARNGAQGVARTFITPEDGQFLLEIEKHIGLLLEEEVVDGFSDDPGAKVGPNRILAETEPGTTKLLKPLTGKFKLGRRR